MLPERGADGEAGSQADGQPAWRDVRNGGDGSRLGDHVPEAGDEHRGTQLDPVGMLGNQRHAGPDILPERWRVGEPDAIITERFSQQRVLDGLRSRGQQTRESQGHGVSPLCGASEIDIAPHH
jgi:hypothetical protein